MNEIKVSVIIPIYNAEQYLRDTIPQVMNQSLKDIEIICVDDGSTDDSLHIIKEFAKADQRIKIISQEHNSAGAARNTGLAIAKGKYLSFLDADDMFEENMLEEAYNRACETEAEIVVFRSDVYNQALGIYSAAPSTIKDELLPDKEIISRKDSRYIFSIFSTWAWDKLFLRSFVEKGKLLFQDQPWINDACFVQTAIGLAEQISILDKKLIHKRINNTGAITTKVYGGNQHCYDCFFSVLKGLQERLREKELYDELKSAYHAYAAWCLWFNIDKFLESPIYNELYEKAKTKYIEEIGLDNLCLSECLEERDYNLVQKIRENNADDYKWFRNISRADGTYLFPFELVPKGSDIILYGAGKVGIAFYRQIKYSGYCNIIKWVDQNYKCKGSEVSHIDALRSNRETIIVLALKEERVVKIVVENIKKFGIKDDFIIWKKPTVEIDISQKNK